MPNRIIKESICTSDSLDELSWFEEVLFYRLIVNCDDYGRFDGRIAVIKNRLFPLKDSLTANAVNDGINKLASVGLVCIYECNGKPYLYLPTWNDHQNVRAKRSKYPEPEYIMNTSAYKCNQAQVDVPVIQSNPIQSLSESVSESLSEDVEGKPSCQQIVDLFHKICVSYPKVRSLSEARKKAIKARLKTYSMDDFRTVFENAENSSFLKGKNDRNWSANFDWLIADKNMAKVLEGNYADKASRYGRKENLPGWFGKRELDEDEERAIQRMMSEPKELGVAEHMAIQRIMSEEDQAEAEQLRRELQEAFGGRN